MKTNDFSAAIERNINDMIDVWAQAVRSDSSITSDIDLNEGGLRDHLPQVLEEIVELLRSNADLNISNMREARVSTYTRYTQKYRIRNLVAEIAILRAVIFGCLGDFAIYNRQNLELPDYIRAANVINAYLDEELRYGVSIFCENDGYSPVNP